MILALRLGLPLVLAISLHAIPRLAFPLSGSACPEEVQITDISTYTGPRSEVHTTSPDTHLSSISTANVQYRVTGLKKHTFRVKDSDVVLSLSLGKPLDRASLIKFLEVAEDHVVGQVAKSGSNTTLPTRTFKWDTGEALAIFAESSLDSPSQMTWSILRDAIRGLQEFSITSTNYCEATCHIYLGNPTGPFAGVINLDSRQITPYKIVPRDSPTSPVANNTGSGTSPLQFDPNVHLDLRPQWQRLEFRAVRNILVVTEAWAAENIERAFPAQRIDYPRIERSLNEGVQITITQAPGKRLTYGLVLETVRRLLAWEMGITQGGAKQFGKAVEFGILEQGTLKAAGSIKKERIRGVDVTR